MTTLTSKEELASHFGPVHALAAKKEMRCLDRHARHFVSLSPFLCMATSSGRGMADNSPRGDAPGFVAVLDSEHLLIPERPGNNRLDTLSNLIEYPAIGLIFFLPGVRETLRVNGTASVLVDDPRLEPLAVRNRLPAAGILVKTSEVYFHCAKALLRSKLWDPSRHVDNSVFPSLGQIMADQISTEGTGNEIDARLKHAYETTLY